MLDCPHRGLFRTSPERVEPDPALRSSSLPCTEQGSAVGVTRAMPSRSTVQWTPQLSEAFDKRAAEWLLAEADPYLLLFSYSGCVGASPSKILDAQSAGLCSDGTHRCLTCMLHARHSAPRLRQSCSNANSWARDFSKASVTPKLSSKCRCLRL